MLEFTLELGTEILFDSISFTFTDSACLVNSYICYQKADKRCKESY